MGWSRPPAEVATYAAAVVVLVASQALLWDWAIEDAAISLAYARNLAAGLGPVPFPGGVPTEGYSNPLWVALLVPWIWLGADPFAAARWLALALSVGGIFATAAAARPTLGHRGASFAALAFAAFAPFNIWAQSGLEAALFNLLLALGSWRLQVDGRRSWAALCFLGLSLTRPEAGGLAALGFGAAVLWAVPHGRVGERVRGWVSWALLPFLAYHGLRYATFAAELPATAYAKVDAPAAWWDFASPTWKYLRRFGAEAGFVAWIPAMLLAAAGSAELGRAIAGTLSIALGLAYAVQVFWGLPDELALLGVATGGLALLGLAAFQGGARAWFAACAAFVVAFSLLTGGDWMKGWRWFAMLGVPVAYGMAAFADDAWRRLEGRGRWLVAAVLVAFVAHQASDVAWFADKPGISPWSIKRRVNHYFALMDTLHLRRRPLVIDQDLGANLLWGAERYDVRDAKGLTDLPLALHRPRTQAVDSLLAEDVFEKPTFVHLHVVTKRTLQHRPWFKKEYVEVPGYPIGATGFHTAQYVRRDVLMGTWEGRRRPAYFEGLEVVGWQTRAPEVSAGAGLFFEIAVKLTEPAEGPLDLLLTANGPQGATASWSLPLGYELLPPTAWEVGEVFVGKWALRLDEGLPEGSYTLSLAVQSGDELLAPTRSPAAGPGRADVRLGQGLRIVPPDAMRAAASDDLAELRRLAKKRSCFGAEAAWEDALAHRIRSRGWREIHEPGAREAIAECWGNRGYKKLQRLRNTVPDMPASEKQTPDEYLKTAAWEVQRGRTWDPLAERVVVNARRVAAALDVRSRVKLAQGDEDEAFRLLALAARTDPAHAFLQRRVERWRARRLGLEDRLGPLPP